MSSLLEHPHIYPALHDLGQRLRAHGLDADLHDDHLLILAPGESPRLGGRVECKPRPVDGDRLWFFLDDEAIEQADRVMDAAMTIADRLRQDA